MKNIPLAFGAFYGFAAVALGAFGAHALRSKLDARMLEIFETGVRYQMYHALALVLIGIAPVAAKRPGFQGPAICFALGILIFSGSLYALALSGTRAFGAITPLGGVLLLVGWGWLFCLRNT